MRKVLLVDDEKYVREGVRAIIEKLETSFKDIHECSDGTDALDIISVEKFDLVILDINMPNIDGISFMKAAQNLRCKPRFVILSGYDEFSFARESLKYGAKAYLLKPVKKYELIEILNKIESEILEEENINFSREKAEILIDRFRSNELNYILLNESLTEQEIGTILGVIAPDIVKSRFYVALLYKHCLNESIGFERADISRKVHTDFYFQDKKGISVRFFDNKNNIVIVLDRVEELQNLPEYLRLNDDGKYFIGVSEACETAIDIRSAYQQASEALKYRLFRKEGGIIYYSDVCRLERNFRVPTELMEKMHQLLCTARMKELEDSLSQIFDMGVLHRYHISYLEEIAKGMDENVIRSHIEHMNGKNDSLTARYENIRDLYNFGYINDYYQAIKDYLTEMNTFLLVLRETNKGKNEINDAIQFIKANFYKDLSMTIVANHVSLNYTYFSYLFKEQTGLNFVDYLTKVRIDKAKELIENTGLKINEIAEKVGYPNRKHFTKIFRAVTGVSPQEYGITAGISKRGT